MEENKDLPAFPRLTKLETAISTFKADTEAGLTKREFIAAMCLQGILASNERSDDIESKDLINKMAAKAIVFTDALLNHLT